MNRLPTNLNEGDVVLIEYYKIKNLHTEGLVQLI